MTDDARTALETELADLERMLEKRRGEPGFAENVALIEARIAAIQQQLSAA